MGGINHQRPLMPAGDDADRIAADLARDPKTCPGRARLTLGAMGLRRRRAWPRVAGSSSLRDNACSLASTPARRRGSSARRKWRPMAKPRGLRPRLSDQSSIGALSTAGHLKPAIRKPSV
jgi:hypothetical protein